MTLIESSLSACRDYPTEWWYPPDNMKQSNINARKALDICRSCPVIKQCLEYALANETHGIWGGLKEREREIERRKRGIRLTDAALRSASNTTLRVSRQLNRKDIELGN